VGLTGAFAPQDIIGRRIYYYTAYCVVYNPAAVIRCFYNMRPGDYWAPPSRRLSRLAIGPGPAHERGYLCGMEVR